MKNMNNPPDSKAKHIVIIAGEESGDLHAAHLVHALLAKNPALKFSGIGGRHMQEAGVELVSNLAQFGVTGFTAVFKHLFIIKKAFESIKAHLSANKPDLLVLVDYPGFNLRLAKFAKQQLGLRILYYISPQIWAWKANRITTIQACIDRMAVILPFEKAIYQKAGVPVSFVGHPLVNKIPDSQDKAQLRLELGLPLQGKLLAMLPGSRGNEIEKHLPVLVETAKRLQKEIKDLHFVVPIAGTLSASKVQGYFNNSNLPVSFIKGQATQVLACSDCVVVASGTASLEAALSLKPMCIIYKSSLLTYLIVIKVIRVKYLGLCNLLQNKMIVPELLQDDLNSEELFKTLYALLNEDEIGKKMVANLAKLKRSLSAEEADCSIAELVAEELV